MIYILLPVSCISGPAQAHSVYLRTVSAPLARARLAATYRACLWLIRACTMMSPHTSHIQATAARPHGYNNRAKFVSQWVSTLFLGEFRKLNSENLMLGMIVDDLPQQLFIAAFIFQLHVWDRAIRSAELAFFCDYLLTTMLFVKSLWVESRVSS